MRKTIVVTGLLSALVSVSAAADPGNRVANHLDRKGDRIEKRMDRRFQ